MVVRATDLLQRLAAQGVGVKALATDSRNIRQGDVFLAYPGERVDGRRYIQQAIAAGASAVIWEKDGFAWDPQWQVPNLPVEGLKQFAGELADEVYGHPSAQLDVIGITGTNGKTSCSQWVAQALTGAGRRTGVIGTLGLGFLGALEDNPNTTPDAVVIQQALKRFVDDGAQAVAMEASSIGLAQGRLNGVHVRTALFTNLSRDHLDYHADMEQYAQAKMLLFRQPGLAHAVLNLDDVLGIRIGLSLVGERIERVGYSTVAGSGAMSGLEHHLEAHAIELSERGCAFDLVSTWGAARIESPLLGKFNVSNLLGVLGVLLVEGMPFDDAVQALTQLEPVAGRMQRVGGGDLPLVVVDYAHSPDALEKVLSALVDVARAQGGRLLCVFGCGGDRDRGKRPLMGEAASRYADKLIVTSDNPRSEDPQAIIDEILPGVTADHEVHVDRREAIRAAVTQAARGDIVLIAGKGHEPYQEIAGVQLPFSDLDEARAMLAEIGP